MHNPTKSQNDTIVIWSRPVCPGCKSVKQFLTSRGEEYTEKVIGENGVTKEDFFEANPGRSSVPQVHINGVIIGGVAELIKYYD